MWIALLQGESSSETFKDLLYTQPPLTKQKFRQTSGYRNYNTTIDTRGWPLKVLTHLTESNFNFNLKFIAELKSNFENSALDIKIWQKKC